MTLDRTEALRWMDPAAAELGVEGVVAKPLHVPYQAGRRSGWVKVRQRSTTEAAVIGVCGADQVVLGRATGSGAWRAIGLSLPLTRQLRIELAALLRPAGPDTATLPGLVAGLPGHEALSYHPVRPEVVVEIEADTAVEHGRSRHRPRVLRVRPDRTPGDLPTGFPG